jgi:hypothetical protein
MESSKVDCRNVYVSSSGFSTVDNVFDGAFAAVDIAEGQLVEKGIMRRLSDNNNRTFDGMNHSMVFTWSDDVPNYTWAFGSGCATFYNTGLDGECNTRMIRYFDEDRFEIFATKDIKAGDELTHTYKSLAWRTTFVPMHNELVAKKGMNPGEGEADLTGKSPLQGAVRSINGDA